MDTYYDTAVNDFKYLQSIRPMLWKPLKMLWIPLSGGTNN